MNTVNTHYPSFDVLKMMDEWDSHTKEIVRQRSTPRQERFWLTEKETKLIAAVAGHIIFDNRHEITGWVVNYIDEQLAAGIGEGQRKTGAPPAGILIRDGLQALDRAARKTWGLDFMELDSQQQFSLLADLQQGKAPDISDWSFIPQKELFNKLAYQIVSAYYSHPTVWSEIGYAGPMYPRTYVRIELGLTDPWEARQDGK